MKIDKKLIKELTDYLNEFGLTELEYGDKDTKIKVSKSNSVSSPAINNNVSTSEVKKTTQQNILGKKVKKGDTIMIVEAMKTMNHVPSPSDGTIKKVCVEDGSPVEFGQTIAIID